MKLLANGTYQSDNKEWVPVKQREDSYEASEAVWLGLDYELTPEFNDAHSVEMYVEDEITSPVVQSQVLGNPTSEDEMELSPMKKITPLGWAVIGAVAYRFLLK